MDYIGRLPAGLADLGPDERERVESVGADLGRLFSRWGYRRVEPPEFEFYSTFSSGSPGFSEERAYRFLDRSGRLLALRPDMTTGIARMVGKGKNGISCLPLRLRYEGVVFRNEIEGSGRSHSFRQAGVELIGEPSLEADAEVIGLACEAARAAGVAGAQLVVGHAGLAWAIAGCGEAEPTGDTGDDLRQAFRRAVAAKDLVSLERILGPEFAGLLIAGPYPAAGADKLLTRLAAGTGLLAEKAAELQALLALLPGYGITGTWLDLGLLRDLDYYTGTVFELVCPGQPEAFAGGGRYDNLLSRFGPDLPATGFALNLSAASAAPRLIAGPPSRAAVAWASPGDRETALGLVRALRDEGLVAETLLGAAPVQSLLAHAEARGCTRLLVVSGGGYREIRTGSAPAQPGGAGAAALVAGAGGIH